MKKTQDCKSGLIFEVRRLYIRYRKDILAQWLRSARLSRDKICWAGVREVLKKLSWTLSIMLRAAVVDESQRSVPYSKIGRTR